MQNCRYVIIKGKKSLLIYKIIKMPASDHMNIYQPTVDIREHHLKAICWMLGPIPSGPLVRFHRPINLLRLLRARAIVYRYKKYFLIFLIFATLCYVFTLYFHACCKTWCIKNIFYVNNYLGTYLFLTTLLLSRMPSVKAKRVQNNFYFEFILSDLFSSFQVILQGLTRKKCTPSVKHIFIFFILASL